MKGEALLIKQQPIFLRRWRQLMDDCKIQISDEGIPDPIESLCKNGEFREGLRK